MRPLNWKHYFVAACIADISACSSTQAIDEYAIGHNLYGEQICNPALPRVASEDALVTACPLGAASNSEQEISRDEDEENTKEESAL